MKNDIKNIMKIASVYIGTVLGAGFASGQEIIQFFTVHGVKGIYGIILSSILFSIIGSTVLYVVYTENFNSFDSFINNIMSKPLAKLLQYIITCFLLFSFCIMMAGMGAISNEKFGIPAKFGIIIFSIICFIVFLFDVKGIVIINNLIAPVLLVGAVVLGLYIIIFKDIYTFKIISKITQTKSTWLLSSILYVSYNSLTDIIILTSLNDYINNTKVAIYSGLVGGLSLGIMAIILGICTLLFYGEIKSYEIPILQIVTKYGKTVETLYTIVLICAMFTTAIANGFGFLTKIKEFFGIPPRAFAFVLCFTSFFLANIGFSKLIKILYPLFGYLGVFMIYKILLKGYQIFK